MYRTDSLSPLPADESHKALAKLPCFFDMAKFSWTETVERATVDIKAELEAYLRSNAKALSPAYNNMKMATTDEWRALNVVSWGFESERGRRHFSKTLAAMREAGAFNCLFSRMGPRVSLPPHNGESNAYMRCHLGLKIPAQLPKAGLRCGPHETSWTEGKINGFCDSQRHSAFNDTDEERYVLIFDVMLPEGEPIAKAYIAFWLQHYALFAIRNIFHDSTGLRGMDGLTESLTFGAALYMAYVFLFLPQVEVLLFLYFRFVCGAIPQWMKTKGLGFYF